MTNRTTAFSARILAFVTACILVASIPSAAEAVNGSIQGIISVRGDQVYLRVRQFREPLPVHGMTPNLAVDLQKMRDGDFLTGHGQILTSRKMVALESIDTVGLKQILGIWRTVHWDVFEFRDFSRVVLYAPNPGNRADRITPRLAPTRQMNYTLAPSSGDNWSIFMADKDGIQLGELQFGARSMNMTLYDSATGRVNQKFELAPIRR